MQAILFMKAESERLPHKNIKLFDGKPLFWYVVNSLLQVESIEQVCIDTDSREIAELVIHHFPGERVKLFDRPEHLKGQLVTANSLVKGLLDKISGATFVQTHVTNPLLTPDTIKRATTLYQHLRPDYDSLFAVTRHQSHFYSFKGEPLNHNPSDIVRTQDLPPVYEDNHCLYIFDRKCFELWGRVGLKPYMMEISKIEAIDIDTQEDWDIAEAVKKYS